MKYICIHGHFYQPPRENPWLDKVEVQDSAHPFHDWNARITDECYNRNTASRILNEHGDIVNITNNYAKMSFNFGPTLLSWMEQNDPECYLRILEADRLSQDRFGGHGSAMAQVYNHMIMPLANERDKRTQVLWGIADFKKRFNRMPEGMWLAETAVDLETLDIMAEYGIIFTVLAPHQAKGIRLIGDDSIQLSPVDPKMPYLCRLPSGKTINIFFYDGPTSRSVAFEGLLEDGKRFANRLLDCFPKNNHGNHLVHIATDGESYGHHHKFGDMALAYALHYIEENNLATLTNYGQYLTLHPPTHEAEIVERTSWSCVHGVERWYRDCGCCSGGKPEWHQQWREPFRNALDWLRDLIGPLYEEEMKQFVHDPWQIRNEYIQIVLKNSDEHKKKFIKKHVTRKLSEDEQVRFLKLLEIQHNALLMYTSCGWFFDEISGIEGVQCLKYAARVAQLFQDVFERDIELEFVNILKNAPSNVPDIKTGARAYMMYAKPSVVDLLRVGAHYAITSLYADYPNKTNLYSFHINRLMQDLFTAGRQRLLIGRVNVRSNVTWEHDTICYAVFHMGDHNFIAGAQHCQGEDAFYHMAEQLSKAFEDNNIQDIVKHINDSFPGKSFSLWHLFREEQQEIITQILKETMGDVEGSFRDIYEKHYSLVQIKDEIKLQLPKTFVNVVEFVIRQELANELAKESVNLAKVKELVKQIESWSFQRDQASLMLIAEEKITERVWGLKENIDDTDYLRNTVYIVQTLHELELPLDLWQAQNIFFILCKTIYPYKRDLAAMKEWADLFETLGKLLKVSTSVHVRT